jgi:hypothetical protein
MCKTAYEQRASFDPSHPRGAMVVLPISISGYGLADPEHCERQGDGRPFQGYEDSGLATPILFRASRRLWLLCVYEILCR